MGHEVLDALVARAAGSGVFLDFDGTLSDIAPTPEQATAVPGAAKTLGRLAERFRIVAIVTGRRVAEVERRLGRPKGVRFFGLYGLERGPALPGGSSAPGAVAARARAVEGILPRVLELAAAIPGSLVEPKGANLAVHYRLSPDPGAARAELLAALVPLARGAGMTVIEGKHVLELVPSGAPTKGDVVLQEASGLDGILYAGDDLADVEAFAAVDRLAAAGAHGVKLAVRSAETPPDLLDAADLTVDGPAGLLRLLETLTA